MTSTAITPRFTWGAADAMLRILLGPKVLLIVLAEGAGVAASSWLMSINWTGVATGMVAIAMILANGYVMVRAAIWKARKTWEEENKASLTGHIEDLSTKLAEVTDSLSRERASIHAERNEANNRHLQMLAENADLRNQVGQLVSRLVESSRLVADGNQKIADLTEQVERFRAGSAVSASRIESAVNRQTDVLTVAAKDHEVVQSAASAAVALVNAAAKEKADEKPADENPDS